MYFPDAFSSFFCLLFSNLIDSHLPICSFLPLFTLWRGTPFFVFSQSKCTFSFVFCKHFQVSLPVFLDNIVYFPASPDGFEMLTDDFNAFSLFFPLNFFGVESESNTLFRHLSENRIFYFLEFRLRYFLSFQAHLGLVTSRVCWASFKWIPQKLLSIEGFGGGFFRWWMSSTRLTICIYPDLRPDFKCAGFYSYRAIKI